MADALTVYGFLSAKLKTRISAFLPGDRLDDAIRAKSLQEAFLPLRGSYFESLENIYSTTGDLKAVEAELFAMEAAAYIELFHFLEDPALSFVRATARAVEIEAVKSVLRLWFDAHARGRAIDDRTGYIFRGRVIESLDMEAIVNAPTAADLVALFRATIYEEIVSRLIPEAVMLGSVFELESAMDRLYFEGLFEACSRLNTKDQEIARRFVGLEVDIQNLTSLVRLRSFHDMPGDKVGRYLIDFGSSVSASSLAQAYTTDSIAGAAGALLGHRYENLASIWNKGDTKTRLAALERVLRQVRVSEAERLLGGYPFSIGIILSYLVLKTEELRGVRTVLNAKYYGLAEDRIRSVV
ncbi:MAG: hypothetical protein E4H20_08330 [Spirochaetales bacterium]|nr:MAG: hypothetical protein E4H20_08330 [Spirochaetales bacterium]